MKSKNFITKEKVEKLNSQINKLITDEQYIYGDKQKEIMLLPIIKEQLKNHYLNNPYVRTWLNKLSLELDNIKDIKSLSEIPLLPSKMFKIFDLNTSKEPLQRILYSSSTTGQTPSKIPLDKITSQRQTNALLSILKNFFSKQRRPLLIIDSSNQNKGDKGITARGAAIRGFNILSKETVYACDQVEGELIINKKRLVDFFMKHRDSEIFIMGFTYIIWSKLVEFLKLENLKINCKNVTLIHGGGWKKLEKIKVTKEVFSKELAKLLRTEQKNILDYYGMVEQGGVIFIDCMYGHKHCPNFADIKIRNLSNLKENTKNQPGYIEIISILPNSYPGISILTEDIGEILGFEDCPCGRKGKYFVFRSRSEKSEVRGCGDTFRE